MNLGIRISDSLCLSWWGGEGGKGEREVEMLGILLTEHQISAMIQATFHCIILVLYIPPNNPILQCLPPHLDAGNLEGVEDWVKMPHDTLRRLAQGAIHIVHHCLGLLC